MNSEYKTQNKGIIGLPYYTRRRYAWLLSIAEDADDMYQSWDKWYKKRESLERDLIASGYTCKDIDVDIRKLVDYCKKKNIVNNSANRTKYLQALVMGEEE
jgi:hypothetical protein